MQPLPTRRHFIHALITAGAGLSATQGARSHEQTDSTFNGVTIGLQSYSFRDRPVEQAIAGMQALGIGSCELWGGHAEPVLELRQAENGREKLRAFRLETPLSHYEQIGEQCHVAGIDLYAFNYSIRDDFTDGEIERGFEMAKALGAKVITASGTISVASRVNRYAKRYDMLVGMHNHSGHRENEFTAPADFAAAMEGHSHIAVNLDIGHFIAAGFDPLDYIRKHHERIVTLHVKDRMVNQGDNVPFGTGDTPIREVLQLLRDNEYPILANIEYEYKGADTVEEIGKCFAYCKDALLA